ncbi:MAG: methyltransferase [Alcaligenaceae bacterium]|jgi:predicted nicotinamide N-methyase|nr:methyltransferase [Alcaligenaceae bacterium]
MLINKLMPDIETRKLTIEIGAFTAKLCALKDKTQYADPDGSAERAGICDASWSLFGQLWPAGKVLAKAMKKINLKDRRVLELGCGLALPSLILKHRGADVTASDYHPVSKQFLAYNCELNNLDKIPFIQLDWEEPQVDNKYELIIASDVLYDPGTPKLLANAVKGVAADQCKVLVTCPGRGYKNQFSRFMKKLGFKLEEIPVAFSADEEAPYKGRILRYQR